MGVRIIWALIVAGPSFACHASAQVPTWKLAKGQILEYERRATQVQMVALNGKSIKTDRASNWQVRLEVEDIRADRYVILTTLTKVEQKIAEVDLIDPKLNEKMEGSRFTLDVTADGRLFGVKGYEDFLKRLADKDPDRRKALHATFSEGAMKEALGDLFGPLPPKGAVKGAGWQGDYDDPIPHFGNLRSTASYLYQGLDAGLERISYTVRTKYESPPKDDKMTVFRVAKGRIDMDKGRGMIAFDPKTGRLIQHDRSTSVRGTLTIDSMDRQLPLEFTSESEVKIRIKN